MEDKHRPKRISFKGVSKSGDSWKASVFHRGAVVELGFFETEQAAARGVDKANLEFAQANPRAPPPELNFPDSKLSDDGHEEECVVSRPRSCSTHTHFNAPSCFPRCAPKVGPSFAAINAASSSISTASSLHLMRSRRMIGELQTLLSLVVSFVCSGALFQ